MSPDAELVTLKAEIDTLNKQLDALEQSRTGVIELLEQEQAEHAKTKATLAHYQSGVRQVFDTLDRFMDLRVKE